MALAEDYLSVVGMGCVFVTLESGNWYPELLDNVAPEFVWANDSLTLYYVRKHKKVLLLPYQVWRHTVALRHRKMNWYMKEKGDTFYVSLRQNHFAALCGNSSCQRHHWRSAVTLTRNWPMPSRFHSCCAPQDREYGLVTIET